MQKWPYNNGGNRRNHQAFTLVELMIAVAVFLLAFIGILISYLTCLDLNEMSRNTSMAVHACKARLEAIQNTPFNQMKATYNGSTFTVSGLAGRGVSYVDDTNARLLQITVSVAWKQPTGRIIGEDIDLDGQLDGGEDKNGNGMLDSPVKIVTSIFQ